MVTLYRGRKEAEKQVNTYSQITTNQLTWLAIHGNLCLALRHPQNKGASRQLVINFVNHLGSKLVEWQVITIEELEAAHKLEREESPHGSRTISS